MRTPRNDIHLTMTYYSIDYYSIDQLATIDTLFEIIDAELTSNCFCGYAYEMFEKNDILGLKNTIEQKIDIIMARDNLRVGGFVKKDLVNHLIEMWHLCWEHDKQLAVYHNLQTINQIIGAGQKRSDAYDQAMQAIL